MKHIPNGTILLVHSTSKLAQIIQKVQMKKDAIAGYWNHSGIILQDVYGRYWVYEATELPGRKFRGAVRPTPLEHYLNSSRELLFLVPNTETPLPHIIDGVHFYVGTPYDIPNLAVHQLWYYKFNIWLGRKGAKAKRKMVCHEYVQSAWNKIIEGLFEQPEKAQVSDIYHNKYFSKKCFQEL